MSNELKRIINLARKTGDRIIVVDSSSPFVRPYVVMDLDSYEKLTAGSSRVKGLTEDELLDKINGDIAVWKNAQENEKEESQNIPITSKMSDKGKRSCDRPENRFVPEDYYDDDEEDEDEDYLEDEIEDIYRQDFSSPGLKSIERERRERGGKRRWQIPSERKNAAEEIVEEDRHYLEEVPF